MATGIYVLFTSLNSEERIVEKKTERFIAQQL